MKINHDSWNSLVSLNGTDEKLWESDIGDTITLSGNQLILTNYNDSVVHTGEGFIVTSGQKLLVVDTSHFFTTVRTLSDSIGLIQSEDIKQHVSGNLYLKNFRRNYYEIQKNRNERIERLRMESGLSVDEFRDRIAKEHRERTGEQFMSFN